MKIKVNFDSPNTQYIFNKFIQPFIQYKPPAMPFIAYINNVLFHLHERSIREYRVLNSFKMPGLYRKAPLVSIQYYGRRDVTPEDRLWVRRDITEPDRIDVEVQFQDETDDSPENVFLLTEKEFKSISFLIKPFNWRGIDVGGKH